MAFTFTKDLTWLRRVFLPRGPRAIPSELDTLVVPVVDVLGSLKWEEHVFSMTTGAVGVAIVDSPVVPATEVWFLMCAETYHGDAAAQVGRLAIRSEQIGREVVVFPNTSASSGQRFVVLRDPLMLPPLSKLRAEWGAMAAGAQVTLGLIYVPLVLGETVWRG